MRYVSAGEVLLAVDGDGRALRFLPVTRLWHLDRGGAVQADGARAVTPEEAGHLVSTLRPPPGRTRAAREAKAAAWQQIGREGEVLTTAEVGLTASQVPGHRPITAAGLAALLEAREQTWTKVVRYDADTDRTAPYHVMKGYAETSRFDFSIDARMISDDESGQHIIEIRRMVAKEQ